MRRPTINTIGAICCGVVILLSIGIACQSNPAVPPDPTATRAPTATLAPPPSPSPTPSPTAATAATATPTPSPSPTAATAATAAPTPSPTLFQFQNVITDIELDTPVRDVLAMMTDEEVACIRGDVDDEELYEAVLDQTSLFFLAPPPALAGCIGRASAVDLVSSLIFKAAGPVDAESCIRTDIAAFFAADTDPWDDYGFICLPSGFEHGVDGLGPASISFENDLQVSDWVNARTEEELSCIIDHPFASKLTREEFVEALQGVSLGGLRAILVSDPPCVDIQSVIDFVTAALITRTDLNADIERCVRMEVGEYFDDPPDGIVLALSGPSYYDCLTRGQIAGISTQDLIVSVGGVTEEQRACIQEKTLDSLDVAYGLQSGNPQDSRAIASMFYLATIYVCLPDEEIAVLYANEVPDAPPLPIESIHCTRGLLGERFEELYKEQIGPKMFGQSTGLTEEEEQVLKEFYDSLAACNESVEG